MRPFLLTAILWPFITSAGILALVGTGHDLTDRQLVMCFLIGLSGFPVFVLRFPRDILTAYPPISRLTTTASLTAFLLILYIFAFGVCYSLGLYLGGLLPV
jgi:hypothetical protein